MYRSYADLQAAGSGSGYGGCYCPKEEEGGGLGDLGLLAAGAAAVFLLYQAITMIPPPGRKRRSEPFRRNYGSEIEDFLWTGRNFYIQMIENYYEFRYLY